jgi:uncharacterized protein DUF2795
MQEMQESEVADQFVKGLDYPVGKADIVSSAREASLSSTIQEALKKLPDREYVDAEELTQALNAG